MKFRYIYLALVSVVLSGCLGSEVKHTSENSQLLQELDATLKKKETYDTYFLERVSIMKVVVESLRDDIEIYNLNKRLAAEYSTFSKDSTFLYLDRNMEIARKLEDEYRIIEMHILCAEEYLRAGFHMEAADIIRRYSDSDIPESLKIAWFSLCHRFAGDFGVYCISDEQRNLYGAKKASYRDSLMRRLDSESFEYLNLKQELAWNRNQLDSVSFWAAKMLEITPQTSRNYAMACYNMQVALSEEEAREEKIKWLTLSAIADIKSATRDYAALNELARILFNSGDITRSFRYVADHCLPDAIAYNGKLRPWQISNFFPQLQRAYEEINAKHNRNMRFLMGLLLASLVIMILLCIVIYMRQIAIVKTRGKLEESYLEIEKKNSDLESVNSQLRRLYSELKESDNVKQEYIALFLSILSENINTTRKYKNHVLKYIRMGNTAELVSEIEALPPIDKDIDEFYKMFDLTFINIYPDFIEKFNSLLAEGERIVPKGDEVLCPELRIFALIKLGITDSSKIASLLHYSANTIYNYRAKIKNKAGCDRSEFEQKVRNF